MARHLERAEELLDRAEGVRNRIEALPEAEAPLRAAGYAKREVAALHIESLWEKDVRRWFRVAQRGLGPYLQEQFEVVMPVLASGLPPDTGKPRHTIALDNGVPWLAEARKELQQLQAALGVRRDVTKAAPAPARFEELHASGLVDEKMIHDHATEMRAPRTRKQLSNAIGSAKELTEATLRAALDQLGEPYAPSDDLRRLMKKWRTAIGKQAPPGPEGEETLDKAHSALANLVVFLAEWRNTYGRGHGRPQYPPGLSARHARLAADAAETCVRFIATTMDDLQILPP